MKVSTWNSLVVVSLLAMFCVTAIGCGGSTGGSGYDSPQAVYDAMKAAGEKKDWKGVSQCMTPESQSAMSGAMVMMGTMMKSMGALVAMGGGEEAEEFKTAMEKIDKILEKHGVTEEALKGAQEKMATMQTASDSEKLATLTQFASSIKDKPAFLAEMLTVLEDMQQGKSPVALDNSELQGLEVDGDTATGMIVKTVDGEKQEEPIEFKKINGGWLVEIPMAEAM